MATRAPLYLFTRGERGIFAEVYFPKKAVYQGTIFDALKDGYDAQHVKGQLLTYVESLLMELAEYSTNLFDPYQYDKVKKKTSESPLDKARKRIGMYVSPFQGWSMYEVNGVFFDEEGIPDEELTQVIRLMFRFESTYAKKAGEQFKDVVRAILYFVLTTRGHLTGETTSHEISKRRFIEMHKWEDPKKKQFAQKHYAGIAREVQKWNDDVSLFIFGYLVREFSRKVLAIKAREKEIWVITLFDTILNVIRRSEKPGQQTATIERKEI